MEIGEGDRVRVRYMLWVAIVTRNKYLENDYYNNIIIITLIVKYKLVLVSIIWRRGRLLNLSRNQLLINYIRTGIESGNLKLKTLIFLSPLNTRQ